MIRNENGKWVKHDARLFALADDMRDYDDGGVLGALGSQILGFLDAPAPRFVAIHVNQRVENGMRIGLRPKIFAVQPRFPNVPALSSTYTIKTDLDDAHLLRLCTKVDANEYRDGPDFIRDARHYAEGYFYAAKVRGEQKSGVENNRHAEFLELAVELMAQSETALGRGVTSDLDAGLAASCVRLRELSILKPL